MCRTDGDTGRLASVPARPQVPPLGGWFNASVTRGVTVGLALILSAGVSACTSDDDAAPAATSPSGPASAPASCTPMPILGDRLEGGSDDGTSVSALLERTVDGPVRAGEKVKVVVRMTGAGDLQVSTIGPDGRPAAVDWGPEAHMSSTFNRPGSEWGFGVTFAEPGCWTIALSRADAGSGYLQLEVV
jgi:hypothetical protein